MSGTMEKFCLKWNDFESNVSSAFREIREDKDLLDCTLSCGEKQIQAHKLILSACSSFFKTVFKQNPHNHPLLYLRGISFDHLQSVLHFMYQGEVNVAQEDLNNFLAVAEDLKVKGLTQNNSSERKPKLPKITKPTISPAPSPKLQPAPEATMSRLQEDDDIQEVVPEVKTEPGSSNMVVVPGYDPGEEDIAPVSYDESYDYDQFAGDGHVYAGQMMDTGDQDKDPGELVQPYTDHSIFPPVEKYRCFACGKTFNDRSNCRRHVKSAHFEQEQVSCRNCNKLFKHKQSAQAHFLKCISRI